MAAGMKRPADNAARCRRDAASDRRSPQDHLHLYTPSIKVRPTKLAPPARNASGPSVLQIRAEDVLPENLKNVVFAALRDHERDWAAGAIVAVDES